MLKIFNSISLAIDNVSHFARQGGAKKPIIAFDKNLAEKEIAQTHKIGAKITYYCNKSYPKLLREIYDPPPLLTYKGNIEIFNNDILAIAGPRNASFNGKKFAHKIAQDLGNHNIIIASGMARGIDSYAHQGSLEKGTIAVLAGGVNNIYPPENANLYNNILENGLVISENPISTLPKSINFPKRNRIISGLALGVIIVEAGVRSGTLITARYATEQNREVMAVPGSPFDPRCHGSNRLIKDGATLIENAGDVISNIKNLKNHNHNLELYDNNDDIFDNFTPKIPMDDILNSAKKEILQNLSPSPTALEELLEMTQIPTNIANIVLIQLELADIIENNHDRINLKINGDIRI
ncbi:DNA-processing protein DprA [Rickettsiales bacterium]|nr:DNA-processing protein DprA [Rickettsiales bacterium]